MASACPYTDDDLIPLSLGEPASPEMSAHAGDCPRCQDALARLRSLGETMRTASRRVAAGTTFRSRDGATGSLGKYVIVGTVADDADAIVYRGLHPELDFQVFLIWRLQSASQPNAELQETARTLADVSHPALLRVRDLGFQDNRPFLVTDFLKGKALDKLTDENRVSPDRAANIVAQIASAVAALHERGIVHGAITPSRILLAPDGQPRLGFFSIGSTKCAADDIAALGEVMFFLLTGEPHRGDLAPLERLPKKLRTICSRTLSRGYASAQRLAADLGSPGNYGKLWLWALACGIVLVAVVIWILVNR